MSISCCCSAGFEGQEAQRCERQHGLCCKGLACEQLRQQDTQQLLPALCCKDVMHAVQQAAYAERRPSTTQHSRQQQQQQTWQSGCAVAEEGMCMQVVFVELSVCQAVKLSHFLVTLPGQTSWSHFPVTLPGVTLQGNTLPCSSIQLPPLQRQHRNVSIDQGAAAHTPSLGVAPRSMTAQS